MRIAEIYRSKQGEGRLAGTESVFVRVSGCNLRCVFCDTPFASWRPEGEDLAVSEIVEAALRFGPTHAVITGGEPLLFAEMIPLCESLRRAGIHITIETAGTLYLPVACDLMSISPKLSNSTPPQELAGNWTRRHETAREVPETIRRFAPEYDCQFKFVIDRPPDIDEVEDYLRRHGEIDRARVLLMPQGIDAAELASKGEWLAVECRTRGFSFCPRLHIEWYGAVRGT